MIKNLQNRLRNIEKQLDNIGSKSKYEFGAITLPAHIDPEEWLEDENREPKPTYKGLYNYGSIVLPETMEPDDWTAMVFNEA